MTFFLIIQGLFSQCIGLLIGKVHLIPINLTSRLTGFPALCYFIEQIQLIFTRHCRLIIYIKDRTRQLLIIIRTRIGSIARPSKCTCSIITIFESCACLQLHFFIDIKIPRCDSRRLERAYNTWVTLFTILITPVWIVIVTISQIISFFCRGTLLSSFCRSPPCSYRQAMFVIKDFLCCQKIRERIIECTFNNTFVSPTISERTCKCPAILQ